MHSIRPTRKALTALPRESFPDPAMYDVAMSGNEPRIVDELRLDALEHPVLADARKQIEQDKLSTHQTSSHAADRSSWRGAFTRLDTGWCLAHVERHDEFNSRAAAALTKARSNKWIPNGLDLDVLDAENADLALKQWQTAVLRAFVDAISSAAVSSGSPVTHPVPGKPDLPVEMRTERLRRALLSAALSGHLTGCGSDFSYREEVIGA